MDKQAATMLGNGAQDAREGYGEWPPSALAREINKLPRFEGVETNYRPSNEAALGNANPTGAHEGQRGSRHDEHPSSELQPLATWMGVENPCVVPATSFAS